MKHCYCENSECRSGTHHVPPIDDTYPDNMDTFTECPNEGTVRCEYVGQVCSSCATYLTEYLLPGPVKPDDVFDRLAELAGQDTSDASVCYDPDAYKK